MNRAEKLKATFARCNDSTLIDTLHRAHTNHEIDPSMENTLVRTWVLQEIEKRFPGAVRETDDALFEENENREVNYMELLLAKLTQ